MRRLAVILGLCALLLPTANWADRIIINEFGSVSITNAGIVLSRSELISVFGLTAPPGHSLGSVRFSTGALARGSIWNGGTFSGTGSYFDLVGVGAWTKRLTGHPGTVDLFTGSFVGPVQWQLVSHTGKYDYVFTLSGSIVGMLYNGDYAFAPTKQTIYVNQNQWFQDHRGSIRMGKTNFRVGPEPGTLGLFGTGLIVLLGAMRRKLFGA
jgi:hypothetical protein